MSGDTSTATTEEPEPQGVAANAAQHLVDGVARALTKPRFRGWIHVYSAGIAVVAGASLIAVSWALGSTRAGLATFAYTAATIVHVHRQRHLPPRALEVRDRPEVDEAGGPLDDLRVHRRQLHAVRAAGHAAAVGHVGVVDRLGRRGWPGSC